MSDISENTTDPLEYWIRTGRWRKEYFEQDSQVRDDFHRDGWTSLHWAAKNGSVSTIEALKAAGARSTIEAIEGWTPDLVSIFHHNSPASISRRNEKSELAAK